MALNIDASTPIRWTGTVNATTGGTITSASLTAPANAVLVVAVDYDSDASWPSGTRTISDTPSSGGVLTWAALVERLPNETTAGGASGIWWAQPTTSVSRTISVTFGTAGSAGGWGTGRISAKAYVVTGADVPPVFDAVTANNEGGSLNNNLTTTSLTAGGTGLLFVTAADWTQKGAPTSSDLTVDTGDYAGAITAASGYKAVSNGASVTGNLDAPGAVAAQWKWCQVILRQAAAGAAPAGRVVQLAQAVGRASTF